MAINEQKRWVGINIMTVETEWLKQRLKLISFFSIYFSFCPANRSIYRQLNNNGYFTCPCSNIIL